MSFDDAALVSHAGLLPAASLWQRLGRPAVIADGLSLPGSAGANGTTVGNGEDPVHDRDVAAQLSPAATSGSSTRSPDSPHRVVAGGGRPAPLGRAAAHRLRLHDHRVRRLANGAGFGYTRIRGHRPLIGRVGEPGQPGWIAHTILWPRRSAGSAPRARPGRCSCARTALLRQPAYRRGQTGRRVFSVTTRIDPAVSRAIAGIDEQTWQPMAHRDAVSPSDRAGTGNSMGRFAVPPGGRWRAPRVGRWPGRRVSVRRPGHRPVGTAAAAGRPRRTSPGQAQ